MQLFWTAAMNGCAGLAGYWGARYGLRQPPGLARGLAAALLAWAWVTLGMELLGSAGWLARGPLLGWAALGLLMAGTFRVRWPASAAAGATGARQGGCEWSAIVAVGLLLWGASFLCARSIWLPVKVVSDAPIYHLYFAARWWKEGWLRLIAAPFGESAATYFPADGDLWFTWLLIGWGGDRLAKVGQAPFLVAALLASYGLARRLGAERSSSWIATAWFASSAPLLLFSFEANVDTVFVAGYLVAAFFFVRYALGDGGPEALGLGALAAGGALGTKAIGVVFVPVLFVAAAVAVLRRARTARERGVHLLVLALAPLALSGYWYGRNLVLTGNPLYPLHLELGGRVWLAGWYGPHAMRTSPYYVPVADWRAFCDILLAVVDPRLAPCWTAALLGLWRAGRPARPVDGWVWVCSALAAANIAVYWLAVPYRTQQRFMLQALGLAVVPLARLFDRSWWLRAAAAGLLGLHMLTAQNWPLPRSLVSWDLSPQVPSFSAGILSIDPMDLPPRPLRRPDDLQRLELAVVAIGLAALATAWMWARTGSPPTRRGVARAAAASLGLAVLALVAYPRHPRSALGFYPEFPDYFAGWLDLEARVGPSGARIAYAGNDLPYYLLGSGLRNEVRYINVDAHPDWLMHDYHHEARARGAPTWPNSRPGWDRLHPDYAAWLANLRAERIQILVVARVNPAEGAHNVADPEGFPIERQWADAHPETFEPIHGDPLFRIYRLRPPGDGPQG